MIQNRFYSSIIALSILLISCSSVKVDEKKSYQPFLKNSKINNLSIKGKISSTLNDQSISADCNIKTAGTDSISITLFGPFGITAGKLYATPDYFLYYNTLTNEVFEGKPSADNLKKMFMMPLSYHDLIRLFRNEVPGEPETFKREETKTGQIIYKSTASGEYGEFALIDIPTGQLKQYQRKVLDGSSLINVLYSDFKNTNNYNFPMKSQFTFPSSGGSIFLEINNIEVNNQFDSGFNIKIPAGIKRIKF